MKSKRKQLLGKHIDELISANFREKDQELVKGFLSKLHLNDVGRSPGELDNTRRCILILAEGSVYQVKSLVKSAKEDYRDIVAAASLMKKAKRKLP